MYKTTDIDVRDSVPMLTFCNDALERAVLPALASQTYRLTGFALENYDGSPAEVRVHLSPRCHA